VNRFLRFLHELPRRRFAVPIVVLHTPPYLLLRAVSISSLISVSINPFTTSFGKSTGNARFIPLEEFISLDTASQHCEAHCSVQEPTFAQRKCQHNQRKRR
jgi:hypothetical protein